MGDRRLVEPERAMRQTLSGLRSGLAKSQNRQRWPGAIQRTLVEGAAATVTTGTTAILASINCDPGTWWVAARAGVEISSTDGAPTFTGTEVFTATLLVLRPDTTTVLEQIDSDFWVPAVTPDQWAGGAYAQSVILFGSFTHEEPVTVQIEVEVTDTDAASHLVAWRGGKIEALPF